MRKRSETFEDYCERERLRRLEQYRRSAERYPPGSGLKIWLPEMLRDSMQNGKHPSEPADYAVLGVLLLVGIVITAVVAAVSLYLIPFAILAFLILI